MNAKEECQEMAQRSAALSKAMPDVIKAFGNLHSETIKEGVLSVKTKELIAITVSIIVKCQPCINAHIKGCLKAGVTREELVDAIGVAVLMAGGPGTAYGALALSVYDQLAENN